MMKNPLQALLVIGLMLSGLACTAPAMARIYYIHNDHLGTPQALTDQNQNVVWQADSAPYGRTATTGTVTFNLRYPGQYYDEETGLHYNWNRYYDPNTGRYLTPDPIGLAGGLNPYLYGAANPLKFIDPWGLDFRTVSGQRMTIIRGQRPPPGRATDDPLNPISVGITALGLVPEAGGVILKGSSALRAGAKGCGVATKKTTQSGISVSRHSVNQKIIRGVRSADELDALKNPLDIRPVKIDQFGRPSQRHIGRKAEVAVNPETGKVVSVNPTSTKKAERLLRRLEGR